MKKILFMLIISIVISTSLDMVFAETQNISLKPGFNFIGFTVKPSITPQNLKTQNPAIEDIYLYNAAAGSFLSASESALTSFGIGKGYIIKSNSQFSISIDGETIQAIESTLLKTGFNLIGISKISDSITFSNFMKGHAEIKGIYKWNNASGSFLQVIKNAENIAELIDGVDPPTTKAKIRKKMKKTIRG